ncbi:hypothetical protein VTK26DRAFT_3275 [Humicola hyalothermophila]
MATPPPRKARREQLAGFKRLQQRRTDFFDFYNRGQADQWDKDARKDHFLLLAVPRGKSGTRKWPGVRPEDFDLDNRDPKGQRFTMANAQIGSRSSWGGFGVAALFKRTDATGDDRYYVAKCLFDGDNENLDEEKAVVEEFRGAEHVVRSIKMDHQVNRPRIIVRSARGPDSGIMLMEYLPRGTLEKFACVVSQARRPLSNTTLWFLFDCLFQMAVALRYPPQYWSNYTDGGVYYERFPVAGDVSRAWRGPDSVWIHFDIDPTNILVGDFDNSPSGPRRPHHLVTPVLKLNDFGLCTEMSPFLKDPESMWDARINGKHSWFSPEQFSTEWDYIPGAPTTRAKVAGKYSWKTNMWQLAQVMWCLITHFEPPDGPFPQQVDAQHLPDYTEESGVAGSSDGNGRATGAGGEGASARRNSRARAGVKRKAEQQEPKWSHGTYLCRDDVDIFKNVDIDLRRLVMRCMMDDPADRPEMEEIREILDKKLGEQLDLDLWTQNLPSDPPDHPGSALDAWLNQPVAAQPPGF